MKKKLLLVAGTVLLGWVAVKWMSAPTLDLPEDVREAMAALPDDLDYNIHVKRILSDKCFACHGPDSKKQKADLRLDVADVAYSKKTESGLKAIHPGSMARSDMAHRILSTDDELRMPTPESHLSLTTEEKAVLLKWIEEGAEYKPHWAFVEPEAPKLPKVTQKDWIKNDIDLFVLNRLEQEGLHPSAEADRETLIRRVSFDLTGLPPTMQEIDAFLNNPAPNAYEQMVDHYLQSPRYGERMAAYWLDVSRFADSHGYLDDKHRDASPWRDWVISAYNRNLPFDQFVTWQLAGDLLPGATREQILATGFNRNQKQNSEAGIIPEEFRVEYNVDRTNTMGTALLGLTVSCAKCHDHKYDPISHNDYFSMYAFFNSTFELGSSNYGADNNIVPGPTLLLPTPEQEKQINELKSWLQQHPAPAAEPATDPASSISNKLIASLSFDQLEKIAVRQQGKTSTVNAVRNPVEAQASAPAVYTELVPGVEGKALRLDEETLVHFPPYETGNFERYDPFAFSVWVKLPGKYEESAVLHHSDPRRYGFQGYDLLVKENRLNFRLMHAFPHDAISVETKAVLDSNQWIHVAVSYDGSSKARGIRVYINGKPSDLIVEYDKLVKNIRPFDNIHKVVGFTGLSFGARSLEKTMKGALIDEFSLYNQPLSASEVNYLYQQRKAPAQRARASQVLPVSDSLSLYRRQLAQVYDSVKETMVMADLPKPRTTHVLLRGVYDNYGEEVKPGTPAAILPFSKDLPANRLGLAQWLFQKENPLTARVAVNHLWELIFGRGLVKTSDDFGNQGEMPSHPALLDFLAIRYRDEGWDTKQMQKFILMSATYRQSSVITPELQARDPQNILLARSSRYRMPAEMIRDQALALSGLLSSKIGGPSVYPYQPAGLWEALSDKSWRYVYKTSQGEDLFRRSIYTIVKRSSPPPFMLIFDAPDRNFCTVKRTVSSSPLQALALMNDPTFIEAAKFMATRMMNEGGAGTASQLQYGFRLITGRSAGEKEKELLQRMFDSEMDVFKKSRAKAKRLLAVGNAPWNSHDDLLTTAAYTNVLMALINTDEFVTRK